MEVNVMTTRGLVVKKYTDVFLKTQYSEYLFETIFRTLKIRFNDVVMEFLIKGLGQKLWQFLTLKLRYLLVKLFQQKFHHNVSLYGSTSRFPS